MKKIVFYTEIAYFLALLMLGFGTALMAYGDLGVSMVIAPAYILYLYASQFLSFFGFGVAQYAVQALLILLLMLIMRKAKFFYLLSFVAAIINGIALDGGMMLVASLPTNIYMQIIAFIVGAVISCGSLALLFRCYLPPQSYELFSKEIAAKVNKPIHKVVNFYNLGSLLLSVILSFLFFGMLKGVGIGTVACSLLYGYIIGFFQKIYNKLFCFVDKFPWRKYFEESEKIKYV